MSKNSNSLSVANHGNILPSFIKKSNRFNYSFTNLDFLQPTPRPYENEKINPLAKIKPKKEEYSFLKESQKILDVFKKRDTEQNVRRLKLELENL